MNLSVHGRETISRDHSITDLLEMIHDGQIVLPEFQRDFDWGPDRIAQLLATIAKKWPIGSLLLQEFPGDTFYKLRPIEGGPEVVSDQVRYVALDGQQRLTSLYQALYDAGEAKFAIKAQALQQKPNVSDLEESIRAFDRREWTLWLEKTPFPWEWIPFSAVRNAVDFFLWRDRMLDQAVAADRLEVGDLLSNAYKNGLEAFSNYRIPSTIVESGLEPEAVARIFERVNRGGIPLGAFDLMVARTFEPEWNLRDKWEEACEASPKLRAFFGEDGIPLIRVISLEHSRNVREGSVLSLAPGIVRGRWQESVEAMASALDFLEGECGVSNPSILPYGGFHTVLAGVALRFSLKEHADRIVPWYFSMAFGLGFEGAVNTVVVEQYNSLLGALGGDPLRLETMVTQDYLLKCTRKKKSALWKAFINLLNVADPHDLITGNRLNHERVIVSLFAETSPLYEIDEPQNQLVLGNVLADEATYRDLSRHGIDFFEPERIDYLSRPDSDIIRRSQLLPKLNDALVDRETWLRDRARLVHESLIRIVGVGLS